MNQLKLYREDGDASVSSDNQCFWFVFYLVKLN
jgi:hypothetical protein